MTAATFTAHQTTPALDTPAEILGALPDAPMVMPRQVLERERPAVVSRLAALFEMVFGRSGRVA